MRAASAGCSDHAKCVAAAICEQFVARFLLLTIEPLGGGRLQVPEPLGLAKPRKQFKSCGRKAPGFLCLQTPNFLSGRRRAFLGGKNSQSFCELRKSF